jgi:hypothetical protein
MYKVEQVIAALERRKKGGGRTEVAALGALMSSPCTACRKTHWAAEICHVDSTTMVWRALGESYFESLR